MFEDLMNLPNNIIDVLNRKCGNLFNKEYTVYFQSLCEVHDDCLKVLFTIPDENNFLYYAYVDKEILSISFDLLNSEYVQFQYVQKGKERHLHIVNIGNITLKEL